MSHDVCGKQLLKGLLKYRVDPKLEARAIGALLQSLDCPRSLAVWLMYQNNEHDQLANLEFDPLNYNSLADVRDAYAATKLLSKFTGLNLGADLEEVALQKFKKYEDLCKQSNVPLLTSLLISFIPVSTCSCIMQLFEKSRRFSANSMLKSLRRRLTGVLVRVR
jgi:hypothetical protein